MRSKHGQYPEYHTSLDDLERVVTPEGLAGGYEALRLCLQGIERNIHPKVGVLCEPQLSRRGLYPTVSTRTSVNGVRVMKDLLTWSDGTNSLLDIAVRCDVPIYDLYPILDRLIEEGLIIDADG